MIGVAVLLVTATSLAVTAAVPNGGLTTSFDETGSLLLTLAWLTALTIAAALLFRRPRTHRPA